MAWNVIDFVSGSGCNTNGQRFPPHRYKNAHASFQTGDREKNELDELNKSGEQVKRTNGTECEKQRQRKRKIENDYVHVWVGTWFKAQHMYTYARIDL